MPAGRAAATHLLHDALGERPASRGAKRRGGVARLRRPHDELGRRLERLAHHLLLLRLERRRRRRLHLLHELLQLRVRREEQVHRRVAVGLGEQV